MTGTKIRHKRQIADHRKLNAMISIAKGTSRSAIARKMNCHVSTVSLWTKNRRLLKQLRETAPVEYSLLTGRTNGVANTVHTPLITSVKSTSTTNLTKIGTASLTGYVFSDNVGNHTLIPVSKLKGLIENTF